MSASSSVYNLRVHQVQARGRSLAPHCRSSNRRGSATPSLAAASSGGSRGSDGPSHRSRDGIPSRKAGKSPVQPDAVPELSDPAVITAAGAAVSAGGQQVGKVDEGVNTVYKAVKEKVQKKSGGAESGPDSSSGDQLEGSTAPLASAPQPPRRQSRRQQATRRSKAGAQRNTASPEPEPAQAAAGNAPARGSTRTCHLLGYDCASGKLVLQGHVDLLEDPAAQAAALQQEVADLKTMVEGLSTIGDWLCADLAIDAAPDEGSGGEQLEGSTVPPAAQRAQRSTASPKPAQAAAGNAPAQGSIRGCSMVGQNLASGELLLKGVVELLEAPAPQVAALQQEVADWQELVKLRQQEAIILKALLAEKMAAKDTAPFKAGDASS